jgi:hypothetical protein
MSSPCFPSCPRVAVVWAGHLSDERVVDHSIGKQLRKLTIKEPETQLYGLEQFDGLEGSRMG